MKIWNASRYCVSSLRRGHANLLCIVPILIYVLREQTHLNCQPHLGTPQQFSHSLLITVISIFCWPIYVFLNSCIEPVGININNCKHTTHVRQSIQRLARLGIEYKKRKNSIKNCCHIFHSVTLLVTIG